VLPARSRPAPAARALYTPDVAPEPIVSALLVEDDARLAALTREYLEGHGVVVTIASDGRRSLAEALAHRYDVVLLDLMLPGMDGLQVCRELRARSDVPIVVLTARGEEADRVMGLELGADDYLPKPFSSRELLARIRAVVRRARGQAGPSLGVVRVGGLVVDPGARRATLDGRELALTGYEFDLLKALADRAGRVLSREQLMELARGSAEESFDRSIDVHVSRLRQKLGDDPKRPRLLKTVRGAGYVLAAEDGA
jgi:two-component system, OmpR family, response regulator